MNRLEEIKHKHYQEGDLIAYMYVSYGFDEQRQQQQQQPRVPDIDFLIRTGGETRLSNFCLDRLAYSELLFISPLFPACTEETWTQCLEHYQTRHRRFGK